MGIHIDSVLSLVAWYIGKQDCLRILRYDKCVAFLNQLMAIGKWEYSIYCKLEIRKKNDKYSNIFCNSEPQFGLP